MIDRLSLGGKELTRLQLRNGAVTRQGMTARLPSGDAIERIELPQRGRSGAAAVTVVEDFAAGARCARETGMEPVAVDARERARGVGAARECVLRSGHCNACGERRSHRCSRSCASHCIHCAVRRMPPDDGKLAAQFSCRRCAACRQQSGSVRAAYVRTSCDVAIARGIACEGADAATARIASRKSVDPGNARRIDRSLASDRR